MLSKIKWSKIKYVTAQGAGVHNLSIRSSIQKLKEKVERIRSMKWAETHMDILVRPIGSQITKCGSSANHIESSVRTILPWIKNSVAVVNQIESLVSPGYTVSAVGSILYSRFQNKS